MKVSVSGSARLNMLVCGPRAPLRVCIWPSHDPTCVHTTLTRSNMSVYGPCTPSICVCGLHVTQDNPCTPQHVCVGLTPQHACAQPSHNPTGDLTRMCTALHTPGRRGAAGGGRGGGRRGGGGQRGRSAPHWDPQGGGREEGRAKRPPFPLVGAEGPPPTHTGGSPQVTKGPGGSGTAWGGSGWRAWRSPPRTKWHRSPRAAPSSCWAAPTREDWGGLGGRTGSTGSGEVGTRGWERLLGGSGAGGAGWGGWG